MGGEDDGGEDDSILERLLQLGLDAGPPRPDGADPMAVAGAGEGGAEQGGALRLRQDAGPTRIAQSRRVGEF